jgi:hypothetical protein
MILDSQNIFSDAQAVTATAYSDNVIDLGSAGMGAGEPVELLVQVTEAFSGGTDVSVELLSDDNEAFGSAKSLKVSAPIPTAELTCGYRFPLGSLPEGVERYVRLNFTVNGSMSTGKITGCLVADKQTNS